MRNYVKVTKMLRKFEGQRKRILIVDCIGCYASAHSAYNSWHRAIRQGAFNMAIFYANKNYILIYKK